MAGVSGVRKMRDETRMTNNSKTDDLEPKPESFKPQQFLGTVLMFLGFGGILVLLILA
jgi:hypothetical protein